MFLSKTEEIKSKKAEHALGKIGADLQLLRVKRGERLEDIAAYLGIKSIHLYGLEQGDLSTIPNRYKVRSITSSYANYLGLDSDVIKDRLLPAVQNVEGTKAPSGFWSFAEMDRVAAAILTTSVVLGVFVGWSLLGEMAKVDLIAPPVTAEAVSHAVEEVEIGEDYLLEEETQLVDASQEVEPSIEAEQALASLQELVAEEQAIIDAAEPLTDGQLNANTETQTSQLTAIGQAPADNGNLAPPKEELPSNVLATLVAKRGGAEIFEPENTDARVIVRAINTSWIQVSSQDRSYLWTRTMQPKEMLLVPNRSDLELWAGDASGVEVLLDGTILPPLGPPGTVIRGVSLSPGSLELLSAVVANDGG